MITPLMLSYLFSKVILLHCVSQYPAQVSNINLKAIDALRDIFDLRVGLSDHSLGVNMAIAAVARGSYMIEKHFTYDVNASGPGHSSSLSPDEFKGLVMSIREIEQGLGDGKKICQPEEKDMQVAARRSVVAAVPISRGEVFTEKNLACKQPATGGVTPNHLWSLLGKAARNDYAADDFIEAGEL
jgi:N-acetylneuraminate synthase